MNINKKRVLKNLGDLKLGDDDSLKTKFVDLLTTKNQAKAVFSGTVALLDEFSHCDYRDVVCIVRALLVGCDDKTVKMALDILIEPYLSEKHFYYYYDAASPGVLIGLFQAVNCIERSEEPKRSIPYKTPFCDYFLDQLIKILKTQCHTHMEHVSKSANSMRCISGIQTKAKADLYRAAKKYAEGIEGIQLIRFEQIQTILAELAKQAKEVDKKIREVVLEDCYNGVPEWGDAGSIVIKAFVSGLCEHLNPNCLLILSMPKQIIFHNFHQKATKPLFE